MNEFLRRNHRGLILHALLVLTELLLLLLIVKMGVRIYTPFEKGASWWTQFPWSVIATPIAAVVAALVALHTLNRNQVQQQEHFEKRLNAERESQEKREEAEQNRFSERQQADQNRFEAQTREQRFVDILNRLSSESLVLRANASIRLAEMATNSVDYNAFPILEQGDEKSVENFPFFPRAASQLAAALYIERDVTTRVQVLKALKRMAEFCMNGGYMLLTILTNELADANRAATRGFIFYLAEYCAAKNSESIKVLSKLFPFAQFGNQSAASLKALQSLTDTIEFRADRIKHLTLRTTSLADTQPRSIEAILIDLGTQSQILVDTIRALEVSIQLLGPAKRTTLLSMYANVQRLKLKDCFLVEMRLHGADLQYADLRSTFLHYSLLSNVDLRNAKLNDAKAIGVNFNKTNLAGAKMLSVDLRGASFNATIMEEGDKKANLAMSNWWDARFPDLEEAIMGRPDPVQTELRAWFEKNYPESQSGVERLVALAEVLSNSAE